MNKQKTRRTALERKVCDFEKQEVETKENRESIIAEYENANVELEKLYDFFTNGIIPDQRQIVNKKERKYQIFLCL